MPHSLNGTGTAYYGRAIKWDDGSYVVTEWITILWLPVLPLGSKRVWHQGHENRWRGTSTRFKVASVPVYWPQVCWGYAITGGIFAVGWLLSSENQRWILDNLAWLLPTSGLSLIVVAALAFLLRGRREDTAKGSAVDWANRNRSALALSSAIGTAVGIAIAFVLTGNGARFADWVTDQQYYDWAAVGWGVAGMILAPSLLILAKLVK